MDTGYYYHMAEVAVYFLSPLILHTHIYDTSIAGQGAPQAVDP